ncbi:hypothetical protein ACVWXS_003989 [Lysinibacillus sp. TE18511]
MMDFYMIGLLIISFACLYALTAWCFKLVEEK